MTNGVQTTRINGFAVAGATVAERWAHFRQLIEPELAAKRPKALAPDEPGSLLQPQNKGWKPPKVRKYHGKRGGYRHHEVIKRAKKA